MKIIIGYSGGLDSHCLLHMLVQQQLDLSLWLSLPADYELIAVYVNHGLSPNADAWQDHCAKVCAELRVKFQAIKVQVDRATGIGLEAAARNARYSTLAKLIAVDDVLVTAHHQDDQAETFLLQAMRCAGVKGLAGMPVTKKFAAGIHLRPLLTKSHTELVTYAVQNNLRWIKDESNDSHIFSRNYLRHEIMPRLQQRWPSMSKSLAQAGSYCAEAAQLNTELAQLDYEACVTAATSLEIACLKKLSAVRQKNLVRYWLQQQGCNLPGEALLKRIFTEVISAKPDAQPKVVWKGGCVHRFQNSLYVASHCSSNFLTPVEWEWTQPLNIGTRQLFAEPAATGIPVKLLPKILTVKFRKAGEKVKLLGGAQHKNLKKLLQEWQIPPWLREQVPLIFADDELIAAPPYFQVKFVANDDRQISFSMRQ